MTSKLTVGDHLRNGDLYQPSSATDPEQQWKIRLLRQYAVHTQLNSLLQEKTSGLRWSLYAVTAGACIVLAFAIYFGFVQPGEWTQRFVPMAGIRGALVLIAAVNSWFLVARRRLFTGL